MRLIELGEIRRNLNDSEVIGLMREALMAHSRGECETPMPMHLEIAPSSAEAHIKASYRRGGRYFALKVASTFPGNAALGLPSGSGMMLLCSAATGAPEVFLADGGHLTDVRTAAAAAMTARELGRTDPILGILGSGIQARLQARLHAEVLPLERIWLWGRDRERAEACARDLEGLAAVSLARSPEEVAAEARLIVTATASRAPLLREVQAGSHISAVGSDAAGKQELAPELLRQAGLLLVDSWRQSEKLGELQHAPGEWDRTIEIGAFCARPVVWDRFGITVADFTGLGVEDLYIAKYCSERIDR